MKLIFILFLFSVIPAFALADDVAFGHPGVKFPWQTAKKQGMGTAFQEHGAEVRSKVWFTLARGILTEVYYPRVDVAQVRDSQFLVSDGKSFLHQEQFDMSHEVKRIPGSLAFEIINRDHEGRYIIRKTVWVDPNTSNLIQKVSFERKVSGLRLFYLHKPAAANSIFGDSAERKEMVVGEEHGIFTGWQKLSSSVPWKRTSVGYVGKSDGYTDLKNNFKLDFEFAKAPWGNVALVGELDLPHDAGTSELSIFITFASSKAKAIRRGNRTRQINVEESLKAYTEQWRNYLSERNLPVNKNDSKRRQALAENSLLVLKASEDKLYPGAGIASLSHPWGEERVEGDYINPYANNGYHVVWPRDLYHVANAFLAVDDTQSAVSILERLRAAQYTEKDGKWHFGTRTRSKNGSFPQNFWVDGKPHWGGYQADQTAMPVILTHRLWKMGLISLADFWPMAKSASIFLSEMGPWTHQERWEENFGISPNSAGFVISALVVASEMAFAMGDQHLGDKWLSLADQWSLKEGDNLDTWTFTTNGKIQGSKGNGKYYLRIDGAAVDTSQGGKAIWNATWNPNFDNILAIANTHGDARFKYESEVVDGGFLELVRLGVRSAKNYFIRESIPEMDAMLRVETPNGPGFYRYRFDGYGEHGKGRLWPFLTGERIHYEMQYMKENNSYDAKKLEHMLRGYERFANENHIFSEQVWDEGAGAGTPTDSATPLCWTHAEYLQLLRSLKDKKIFEEIPEVRARYGK